MTYGEWALPILRPSIMISLAILLLQFQRISLASMVEIGRKSLWIAHPNEIKLFGNSLVRINLAVARISPAIVRGTLGSLPHRGYRAKPLDREAHQFHFRLKMKLVDSVPEGTLVHGNVALAPDLSAVDFVLSLEQRQRDTVGAINHLPEVGAPAAASGKGAGMQHVAEPISHPL